MNPKDLVNSTANQNNPNHLSYWKSRGYSNRPHNWRDLIDSDEYDSDDDDSRSNTTNQNNPNNKSYWKSDDYFRRPVNSRGILDSEEYDLDDSSAINRTSRLSSNCITRYHPNNSSFRRGTSSNHNSLDTWVATGAVVAAGLYALTTIISDACNESEEKNQRERRRKN